MNKLFMIAGVSVRQDNSSRYCLNDCHRAAGGERQYESFWCRNLQQINELLQLLSRTGIPVSVFKSQPYFSELKFSGHLLLLDTVH